MEEAINSFNVPEITKKNALGLINHFDPGVYEYLRNFFENDGSVMFCFKCHHCIAEIEVDPNGQIEIVTYDHSYNNIDSRKIDSPSSISSFIL